MFLTIAFLAAGKGTRYSDTGEYDMPKIMVPIEGVQTRPMIAHSYNNLLRKVLRRAMDDDDVLDAIIAITEEMDKEYPELREAIKEAEISANPRYHLQRGYVNGPALTAEQLRYMLPPNGSVLFSNVDQLVKGKVLQQIKESIEEGYDGAIFCFESDEPRYSYVKDDNGLATEMIEKEVISSKASSGHVFYKNSIDFFDSLDVLKIKKKLGREIFISDVCNESIKSGLKFKVCMLDAFVDLGTPEDLKDLDKKWELLK